MILPTKETLPRVALESMNETHEEEIALVHILAEQLKKSPLDIKELNVAIDAWLEHTDAHFSTENQLMQDIGFPAYTIHRAEHERVLAQIQFLVNQYRDDNDQVEALKTFICDTWPEWFDMHVRSMDMATAMFAKMQGR